MADPISSLGTATNIITLVEFTWKLLTSTKNVYQSATGENENNLVLAMVAEDIKNLSDAIDASPGNGKDMQTLVQTSRKIAGELLKALDHLKVKGKKTVWKSLTVALKDVWHKGKIEEFSQRLAQLQAQVASHMQISLLYVRIYHFWLILRRC